MSKVPLSEPRCRAGFCAELAPRRLAGRRHIHGVVQLHHGSQLAGDASRAPGTRLCALQLFLSLSLSSVHFPTFYLCVCACMCVSFYISVFLLDLKCLPEEDCAAAFFAPNFVLFLCKWHFYMLIKFYSSISYSPCFAVADLLRELLA